MAAGRVPFSNGTEVDMFRGQWCDQCALREPGEQDCEEFGLGVAMGEWPELLKSAPVSPSNPLGLTCSKFTDWEPPSAECIGCVTGADLGLAECAGHIAHVRPDCPVHGDPQVTT